MKVDKPSFVDEGGELVHCGDCPLYESLALCLEFSRLTCPTAETYAEACRLAEQSNTK